MSLSGLCRQEGREADAASERESDGASDILGAPLAIRLAPAGASLQEETGGGLDLQKPRDRLSEQVGRLFR